MAPKTGKTERAGKAQAKGRAVLIYDGQCPVCRRTVRWIGQNQREGSFRMLPCQSAEVARRFPSITREACMNAMQLVLPDGSVLAGEEALPEILRRLKRYSAAAEVFRLPGSGALSRAFYRWFADSRYHIAEALFPGEAKRTAAGKAAGKRAASGRSGGKRRNA
jgi:predicted DCC family thiol-disulfide oxidoreductase YuxK